jgi:hypothetical protein
MSNRERWVVYPLLFMSLGMSLTNGLERQEKSAIQDRAHESVADVGHLRCTSLEIIGADGKPRISMGAKDGGNGYLQLGAPDGTLQAQLNSNLSGALLSLFDRTGKIAVRLGYEGEQIVLAISGPIGTLLRPGFVVSLPDVRGDLVEPKSDAGNSAPGKKPSEAASPKEQNNRPEH